ncbi:hypothetical protein [Hyphomonas sp.]|uniref:hypothetical protein n=1 Tax=Hyphomonas sp. TaxID=87 RepID=UPI003242D0BA
MKLAALACLVAVSAPAAFAQENNRIWVDLSPGGNSTVYTSGPSDNAALPVFRVCYWSRFGYMGRLRITAADKGPASGSADPMAPGDCLFASGEKLIASVEADLPPERAEANQIARDKAMTWLQERVEALRALPDPTETDKALLAEFESRAVEPDTVIADIDTYLESQALMAKLEGKDNLTDEETHQLSEAKATLSRPRPPQGSFEVILMSQ